MKKDAVEIRGTHAADLSYGENRSQSPAALYATDNDDPLAIHQFRIVDGATPSFINITDVDRLLQTATHIAEVYARNKYALPHIAVGVKHGNPCGAAVGVRPVEAFRKMLKGDPLAIFGGLVMVNFTVDEELFEGLDGEKITLDGIIAPAFTDGGMDRLRRKTDKCRFIINPELRELEGKLDTAPRIRYVRGGFLRQPNYTYVPNFDQGEITVYGTRTIPVESNLALAWAVGATSNSNTITLARGGQIIGNGVGQQDRVGAAKLATERADRSKYDLRGAVAYSDSFFPFPDAPELLIDAGVSAIFTSSGSVNDPKTIELCLQNNVALYMVPDAVGRGFFGH